MPRPSETTQSSELLGDALAYHAGKKLRQVPDLLIGSRLAALQVHGAVLQAQRALPEIQALGELGGELVHSSRGRLGQCSALVESDCRRVRIVDVRPIRAVPFKMGLVGARHC